MNLKEKIIVEALKLFSLKGYLSTTIDDILHQTGASKGGFYNHFKSKDALFLAVLSQSQDIWRQKVLDGVRDVDDPVEKLKKMLTNYKDKYLKNSDEIPGGCIFLTFSVELDDQRPDFADVLKKGFDGVGGLIREMVAQAKDHNRLSADADIEKITHVIFSGMFGASVLYGMYKSDDRLNTCIDGLVDYIRRLEQP
jgi:TetR/AcrR family transcriptional repressor of nem operon